ncbi:polysaccharide biosynthesis protein [Dissulfurispira sp.]|uniref:polysaccharide biosynthesis protein n=1 Tax=Dissulfurispira sp. TaxID=2817609 RepID=UPI002FD9121A
MGINDLCNIVNAIIVANSVLMVLIWVPFAPALQFISLPHLSGFPRSIFLIDGFISLILLSGIRISKRLYLEVIAKKRYGKQGKKTIIIGAGNTGEMIVRDMARQGFSDFYPIGFLDDDKTRIGTYIHGIKVIGTTNKIRDAIRKYNAEAVIIAIPSLDHKTIRNIYNAAKDSKIDTIKIVPKIYDFHKLDINLKSLEEIRIEDLIGRQAVKVNYEEIEGFLKDKIILITGAGGSIGSEITMQVCAFHPRKVILFDIDETALHNMSLKLGRSFPYSKDKIFFITGDIRDEDRIEEVFKTFSPQIVFHAAAYKHVPMMEYNPKEAVKVNMFGTYLLAKASVDYGVEKFIMISTDKAVSPTSIMGATKRMAEHICKAFNNAGNQQLAVSNQDGRIEFVSVRFGNVLGSRGSVLPLFLEQLRYGGPLTITHREMQRYFMTIPEAVSLVLQASVIGKGEEVLVLDMGEPIKIVELAEELIRIHGLEPYKDVDLEFIGLRPGEKLFEEILTAEEETVASKHKKVFVVKNSEKYSLDDITTILDKFGAALKEKSSDGDKQIRHLLKKYVKHFNEDSH